MNAYYRTFERLAKQAEFFARFNSHRYRFLAFFGPEAVKPHDELFKIRAEIIVAEQMLVMTYRQRDVGSPDNRNDWEKLIGWRPIGEGPIAIRVDQAIGAIERVCRPIIQHISK